MIFGALNPEKIWHQQLVQLPTSPVYCSHFTLGNQKKVIFSSIIHAYFRLFTSTHKKTNCYPLTHHTWKMSSQYLVKCTTFFIWLKVCCIPPNVGGSEKSGLWVGIGGSEKNHMWQMECQASNVTANVQSDHLLHGYMLSVFFATDQLYRPPCSAEIQPCRNKTLPQLVHIADWWYLIRVKNEKDEKFVHFTR